MIAKHLSAQAEANIENVYCLCKYPDRYGKKPKKEKPVLEQYTKYLIYEKLSSQNVEEVAMLIGMLPLDSEPVMDYLQKCIVKLTFYGKYMDMDIVSCLLACLKKVYEAISIRVVDSVLEDIISGLERNDYKESQHRLLAIRFLGELYRYTVINSDLIFSIMEVLMDKNNEKKYQDAPDDSFRVRMVCTLLDTCGKKFEKGEKRAKLDTLLNYFQRYILSKTYMSLDLQFMILDTYEDLRPETTFYKSYEEADEECKKMELSMPKLPEEDIKDNEEIEKDEQKDQKELESADMIMKQQHTVPEEENAKEYERGDTGKKFNDELRAMIEESIKEAKKQGSGKKGMDIPVPMLKKEAEEGKDEGRFNLIMRKGTKPVVKKLMIPKDSKLAIANKKTMNEEDVILHYNRQFLL